MCPILELKSVPKFIAFGLKRTKFIALWLIAWCPYTIDGQIRRSWGELKRGSINTGAFPPHSKIIF